MGSGFKKRFSVIHMNKELLIRSMLEFLEKAKIITRQSMKEMNKVKWISIKRKKMLY
ncbi:Uncharacterised protein [Mycobacteroides abscessus subsp. abscessus]|nr:Uncharacterised protein [Mycobacteroides abscessus subsp. abscessus]